jgi:N-acetylglucosaminyldiphosphoundecaprenol N-acetyl-beta-D-mannosaminyltransferase
MVERGGSVSVSELLEPVEAEERRIPVCSLELHPIGSDRAVARILEWAELRRESFVVCMANVHMLVEAHDDPDLALHLRQADMVLPDGMPLVWLMRRRGAPGQDRIAGMDFLPELCLAAERARVPVYFVGSTPAVLMAMERKLRHEFPRLLIAGMESPPFRPLSEVEETGLLNRIHASRAGLILVALGCPKQERWMLARRERLRGVLVGLGAAFPTYAGFQPRAPRGMQRLGLEWLHRLCNEPRRLWRRYLYTNTKFLWCLVQERRGHQATAASRRNGTS